MKLEPANIVCPKCGSPNYMRHLIGKGVGKLDMKCINCNSYFNFNELYKQKIAEALKPKPQTNADRTAEVGKLMYDELINRLRGHQCDAGEDDTQDFCEECQYDVIVADKSTFSGIRKVCVCGLMNEAADAIEHMQKTILRLEDELGIYDDLPMVDQREPPKEET